MTFLAVHLGMKATLIEINTESPEDSREDLGSFPAHVCRFEPEETCFLRDRLFPANALLESGHSKLDRPGRFEWQWCSWKHC